MRGVFSRELLESCTILDTAPTALRAPSALPATAEQSSVLEKLRRRSSDFQPSFLLLTHCEPDGSGGF